MEPLVYILLVVGGVYLGFIQSFGNRSQLFKKTQMLVGGIAVLLGVVMPMAEPRAGVVWEVFSFEKMEEAKQANQPVIIDFYAEWCVPCHELRRYTYTDKRVIQELMHFRKLEIDATETEAPVVDKLLKHFDIIGLPTILFFNGEGDELTSERITGFIPPAEFLEYLELEELKKS